MKGLKFLILFVVWILGCYITYQVIYYQDPESVLEDVQQKGDSALSLVQSVTKFFENADSWNILYLILFLSILLIFFCINDIFLERFFKTRARKRSFLTGGLLWMSQKFAALIMVFFEFLLVANLFIIFYSIPHMVDLEEIGERKSVLLLGTNKNLRTRQGRNVYFDQRIDAVSELYSAGKVKKVVVSGDNSREDYNEPADMRNALIRNGVPASIIDLDYAGFRTFDSVIRLKKHFGIREALIVSQRFQVERAVFIAKHSDMEPLGYASEGNPTLAMFKRELLAKPRVLLDLYLFNTQPKYGRTDDRVQINWKDRKQFLLMFATFGLLLIALALTYRTLDY